MNAPTEAPLRIRTEDDLLGAVPGLLGFHPEESLVVIVLADGLVQVTARLDLVELDRPGTDPLEALYDRFAGASFLVVAYSASPARAWEALDQVARALADADVLLLLHADGSRWYERPWSDGTPYDPRTNALAAELAFRGLPVRPRRAELERLLEPAWTPDEVVAALGSLELEGQSREELIARATTLHAVALAEPRRLALTEALVLAIAAHDDAFCDEVVLGLTRANAAAAVELWVQVVQGTSPGTSGPALVVLGVAAWIAGQGALQVVCLTRASGRAPGHPWLAFCDLTNRDVVPPSCWDDLRTDFVLARRGDDVPTL